MGPARRAPHARLRGRGGVAGAADGQDSDRWPIAIGWDTVGRIVERVVADHLDDTRLHGLVAIGVDEISYRRGQRYLTSVVDHNGGAIVWCAPGRNAQTLQAFFALLSERRRSIRAVSIDMSGGYQQAIHQSIPHAEICFDPFHVVRLGQRAVDQVRRDEWNAHDRSHTPAGRWVKGTRWSLLKSPEKQTIDQLAKLGEVQQANRPLYRAFLLKEELRLLYHLEDPSLAPEHLDAGLTWAQPFPPGAVRQARAHHPPPSRRDPCRDPARSQQRPPRRSQQPHPPDQPPQLRLPLRQPADRPRLPLLCPNRHPPPKMTFTPKPTGAPF